jgi:hypothetical protein
MAALSIAHPYILEAELVAFRALLNAQPARPQSLAKFSQASQGDVILWSIAHARVRLFDPKERALLFVIQQLCAFAGGSDAESSARHRLPAALAQGAIESVFREPERAEVLILPARGSDGECRVTKQPRQPVRGSGYFWRASATGTFSKISTPCPLLRAQRT